MVGMERTLSMAPEGMGSQSPSLATRGGVSRLESFNVP